jgi:cysteine-rich repeat protein
MKRLAALALMALTVAACVDSDAGIRLLAPLPVDAECTPNEAFQVSLGSYSLAPAATASVRGYLVAFGIESTRTASEPEEVGGVPLGGTGSGDFIASEQELSYASAPALELPTQRIPYSYLLREGTTEDSFITANLLPPAILGVLDAHFAASNEPVTVNATVKLRGKTRDGADVESNEVSLAVVVTEFPGCPAGQRAVPSAGRCDINGQDRAFACEAIPVAAVCGNGAKEGTETCDDGNTTTETACAYGQASCGGCNATCSATLTLTGGTCGDGVTNSPQEACDDGNAVETDACLANCTLNPAP